MTAPTVGVAMCTYNGARHIEAQLASLEQQERLPDLVVISDDGSSDDTFERVATWAARVPFPVEAHRNDRRLGTTANFEKAMSRCVTDIIALADQDDVWYPHKLAVVAERLARPEAWLLCSDADLIDEDDRPLGGTAWQQLGFGRRGKRRFRSRPTAFLLQNRVMIGATMAMRRETLDDVLPFPGPIRHIDLPAWILHDGWISLVATALHPFAIVDEPLLAYRLHPSQQQGLPASQGKRETITRAVGGRGLDHAARRRNEVDRLNDLARRLKATPPSPRRDAALGHLADRRDHFMTRGRLPDARLRRLPLIASEAIRGRYARHSNGLWAAARDLII